jgi:hypothetical protein
VLRYNSLNGLKTVEFTGTTGNSRLTMSSSLMSGATAGCFLAVFKLDNDPPTQDGRDGQSGGVLDGFTSDTGSNMTTHHPWTSDGVFYEHFGTTVRKTTGNPTPSFATSARVYSAHSAASDFKTYIDATQFYSTATNTVGFGTKTRNLGNSWKSTRTDSYFVDGNIAEIVIFNSSLGTTDRQKMEGYLAWKWGLEANLPVGHPYKSAAPT